MSYKIDAKIEAGKNVKKRKCFQNLIASQLSHLTDDSVGLQTWPSDCNRKSHILGWQTCLCMRRKPLNFFHPKFFKTNKLVLPKKNLYEQFFLAKLLLFY